METTCSRCHHTVEADTSFCPYCGLPQLVYNVETETQETGQPAQWNQAVRDASSVAWRPALRTVVALAIPAGVLCAFLWPEGGVLGLVLMGVTGAWAVSLYMRSQQPAWITIGAGARIGLVTGILGGWTAAGTAAAGLYALRYGLHQGSVFDNFWESLVNQQFVQQWASMGVDAQTTAALKAMLLSPEGRAAWVLCTLSFLVVVSLLFAMAGGALSARMQVRRRRPGI
jgi:fluoride ion exporter CrcB/FEX